MTSIKVLAGHTSNEESREDSSRRNKGGDRTHEEGKQGDEN